MALRNAQPAAADAEVYSKAAVAWNPALLTTQRAMPLTAQAACERSQMAGATEYAWSRTTAVACGQSRLREVCAFDPSSIAAVMEHVP
jgi:hypothetical protein